MKMFPSINPKRIGFPSFKTQKSNLPTFETFSSHELDDSVTLEQEEVETLFNVEGKSLSDERLSSTSKS